ncbi:MAG: 50S ribosomal protein L9 [Patescibacteria group bacterium]|nr:50S ribosomal protein L9 [Patescibacteria group bacterium]MDD5715115.1 50S ribosomal protein L9 [Patescibacteria group bacterium]
MEVIFIQNVKNVAQSGDIKRVNDGYARNFLIPKKLAVIATNSAKAEAERSKAIIRNTAKRQRKSFEDLADAIKASNLVFTEGASEQGTLFHGISADGIAEKIKSQHNIALDPSMVVIERPLKTIGIHTATLLINGKRINFNVEINKQ